MVKLSKSGLKNICKMSLLGLVAICMLNGCSKKKEDLPIWDQTLIGIDEDKDGIRDEILKRMNEEFKDALTPDEKIVMEMHAKNFQEILEVNVEDKTSVLLARSHLDDIMNCAIMVFGDDMRYNNYTIMLTQLKQWYFNTDERKAHRKEFSNRSAEYHYKQISLEGINTCDFEFSEHLKEEIKYRAEVKAKKEELERQKQNK